MKLLLVDDEEYVIESIKNNMDWENCGVQEVYTAFSLKQAKNVMELIPIDVIISDIVMPQGTGFDFVDWVRKKNYGVQVIFLTSYAEFDYARRAISLNSVDYLLKPINYEKLSEALKKAVNKAEELKKYYDFQQNSRHWMQKRPVFQKDFWQEVLRGNISEQALYSEAQERYLPYEGNWKFLLIYVVFYDQKHNQALRDEKTLSFIVENVLFEMLESTVIQIEAVITIEKGCCAVICAKQNEECIHTDLKEMKVLERFIQWLSEKMHMDIWCGAGCWRKISGTLESLTLIRRMHDNTLSTWNRVLYLSDFEGSENTYQNPNLSVWKVLLEQEKKCELLVGIDVYLEDLEHREMITREILKSFRMDMTQLIYSWLAKKGIKAYLLFSTKEDEVYYQNALQGIYGAKKYIENLVSKAIQYRRYVNKTESMTEQIRRYIDIHYREEIRRDDLSEMVYLNTDYMSRIFKKEVGMSISSYLLQKRVNEAKKLLTQSNLPINTVSIYVGYSNFSYFTKMFKENTGLSPLEYRRKHKN